ncbi:putative reverse transcriptase zinc-binding domain-containing protein [Helianthus anomalus]
MSALCVLIRDTSLTGDSDKWQWSVDASGLFSVNSAYELMNRDKCVVNRIVWEWCRWVPSKCNVFAWRAVLERLPTRLELCKRGIGLPEVACPMCGDGEETASHLFTACSFSTAIWVKISSWCNVPFPVAFSFVDVVEAFRFSGLNGSKLLRYQGIVIIACWMIWKARNDLVFNAKSPKVEEVFCSIRSLGFFWFNSRSKCIDLSWRIGVNLYSWLFGVGRPGFFGLAGF